MNKLFLIISFTLFSTIEVTAQITEDVAKEFFNSAYNAYCEHDYEKSLYMSLIPQHFDLTLFIST